MSLSSPFEVARSAHEESERYSSALASILNTLPSSSSTTAPSRSALTNAHLASIVTDRIVSRNRNLLDFYTDDSGIKKDEEALLAGGHGANASDSLSLFYSRLRHIQQHHEKYPSAPPETFSLDLPSLNGLIAPSDSSGVASTSSAAVDPMDRLFSGEEGVGRYLDLYEYHSQYINLKGVKRISYLSYLDKFHHFDTFELTPQIKRTDAYKRYLTTLLQYLVTYLRKIRPLDDVDGLVQGAEGDFDDKWTKGEAKGWEDGGRAFASSDSPSKTASGQTQTPKQKTKPAADGDGIWCEACQKSFAKQTVFDAHLNGKKHKKASEAGENKGADKANNGETSDSPASSALVSQAKSLAKSEYTIAHLANGVLSNHRTDTRSNVERRAALTEKERAAEAEELARQAEEGYDPRQGRGRRGGPGAGTHTGDGNGSDSDSDSDSEKIYNPKKLPLGWDGRPIPVWLYKLHGLGVEFNCEICSDHIYHGRKNFDRHFSESRHSFGMRALGLPNTKHFHGITSIQDALALADKLKKEAKSGSAVAAAATVGMGDVEEVEDENGNTYSRKDYELLKRQGLI